MNKFHILSTAVVSGIIAFSALTTTASAACKNSVWSKTSGTSFASTIKGRDCGGNLSARFIGPAGNTGWVSMKSAGANKFRATFVDANITTKIRMKTFGSSMNVLFKHYENSGNTSTTKGTYNLISYQ